MAAPEPLDAADFPELTDRQRLALPVVLAAPTLKAGLEAAGIPRATWHRWGTDPRLRATWRRLQRELLAESLGDLRGAARYAVAGLLGLMASKAEAVRLQACREVLALGLRTAELDDLAERIERVEAAVAPLIAQARL